MIVDMDARILGNDRGLQSVWSIVMNILAFGIENPGGEDLLLVPLIVLFLFGAKKLPDLARILRESMNEFRKGREDIDRNSLRQRPISTKTPSSACRWQRVPEILAPDSITSCTVS